MTDREQEAIELLRRVADLPFRTDERLTDRLVGDARAFLAGLDGPS